VQTDPGYDASNPQASAGDQADASDPLFALPALAGHQFQRLVQSLPVIFYNWCPTRNPHIRFLNGHTLPLFGFPDEAFEKDPDFWLSRVHPDDIDHVDQSIRLAMTAGHCSYTYRFKHADGSYRHFQAQLVATNPNSTPSNSDEPIPSEWVGIESDITEEKTRAEAIDEERNLLDAVLRISSVAVTVLNPKGEIVLANDHATQVLGVSRQQAESMSYNSPGWGTTDWDGKPIADKNLPFSVITKTLQPLKDHQLAINPPDGQRRLLKVNGEPIFKHDGSMQYAVFAVHDVTNQQQAYIELARSESRYRRLVESQLDLVCRYGKDGKITFANKAFCRLFDTDVASLVGQPFDLFTKANTKTAITDLVPTGGTYVQEQSMADTGGTTRHVQWIHRSITNADGQQLEFLAVGRDITERRSAEHEVQRMKDRLSLIIESCPAIFFTAEPGPPFGLTSISGRNYELTGYHPDEFISPSDRWQRLVHPGDLPHQLKELHNANRTGSGRLEFRLLTRQGEYRWFQKDFVLINDQKGNPLEVVGYVVDINDQKVGEQVLRESREHYRVMAKNNSRLLSEVNHRVRNNLSGLLGLLRIAQLDQNHGENLAERLRTRLHAMARLHNLLAGVHWQDLDLKQMLRELLGVPDLLHPLAQVKMLEGPDVPLPPRIAQPLSMTITEMLINAAKHGAGKVPGGQIHIQWTIEGGASSRKLVMDWRESNGPTATGPHTPSMGTDLINGFVGYELGGVCELSYPPEGAHHKIWVPLPEEEG